MSELVNAVRRLYWQIHLSLSQQFFLGWTFLFFVKDNALEKIHELSGLAFLQSKTSVHESVITQICLDSI